MIRTWMITGCSSGFGRLLTERLLDNGEQVIATARSAQALFDLGRQTEDRILRMPLDVCDSASIDRTVEKGLERFGTIDVVVNNAGYGYFGTQEEGEIEEVKRMFETNVFGLIAVTQRVLPLMRQKRSGTIVNLSSIAGKMATPRGGFYQSTKWGVEALSEALHLETVKFGIRVVIIEPGSYETDFGPRSSRVAAAEADPASPYALLVPRWRANAVNRIFPQRQNPSEVVDAIISGVDANAPFLRLPVGNDASALIARRAKLGDAKFVEWIREIYYDEQEA